MASAKSSSLTTLQQRRQVAEAVVQGFLDSVVSADLTTAKSNGYTPGAHLESAVESVAIAGINR